MSKKCEACGGTGLDQTALNYPGDDAVFKEFGGSQPSCSCDRWGDDAPHSPSCKFWQFVLALRKRWREKHLVAWSCSREAGGEPRCEDWCGGQRICVATTK